MFEDSELALDAFQCANEIGYKLTKNWTGRPRPRRPMHYKAMKDLWIRTGKSFSGDKVGVIRKGAIVTVNTIKGRRARLIEVKNGKIKNIGWVSVHTPNGITLLRQLTEL